MCLPVYCIVFISTVEDDSDEDDDEDDDDDDDEDDDDDDDDDDDKRHLARKGKKDKTVGRRKSNMASRTRSIMASRTRKEILKRHKVNEYKHVMLAKSKRRNQIDRMARGRKHDSATNAARERTRTSLKKSKSAIVRGHRQSTTNTRANGNVRQTRYHGNGKMYTAQTVVKMRKEKSRNEVVVLLKSLIARLNTKP